jgi:hypothetical protein
MQLNPKVKFNTSRNSSNTSSDTNGSEISKENTSLKILNPDLKESLQKGQVDDLVLEKLPQEL